MASHKALSFTADIAEVMLRNGAETYRVEETIHFVLKALTGNEGESFVSPTSVICTKKEGDELTTVVRRIRKRTVNFEKVDRANDLSRRLTAGKVSLEGAVAELEAINNKNNHSYWGSVLTAAVCCGFFVFIFGGVWQDGIAAGITGFFLYMLREGIGKLELSNFMSDIIGGAMVAFMASVLVSLGIGQEVRVIIVSAIMLLVPGVALTNAFRDILEGDYLAGMSRLAEALFVAVCIALGVGMVLRLGIIA